MIQTIETHTAPCDLPLTHTFSDGVYAREIFMPAGMLVVGHVHKTRHLNIVSQGKAKVWAGDSIVEITAPYTFESDAGVQKVLYIEEDMFWTTIHITEKTDILELEEDLIDRNKSEDFSLENIDMNELIGG